MMNIATTQLDWASDVVKHYVRREAWLPAALAQAEASRNVGREPKYLTFCAAEAIDVFLFLMDGVLVRDPGTNRVLNTYFCERNPEDFTEITRLVGSNEQGFLGDFATMVLFEDDDETRGLYLDDVGKRYAASLRNRLSAKARHQRLRSAVPFDVINLDICGTFFPPKSDVLSPMLRSIRTLLDWQTSSAEDDSAFSSFTLFLTAHVEPGRVNDNATEELIAMVENNRAAYAGFSQALEQRFGANNAIEIAGLDFAGFYCTALPKVIVSEAFQRGWTASVPFSGLYERTRQTADGTQSSRYSMLAWTGKFERRSTPSARLGLPQTPTDREYARLIGELTYKPQNIDLATESIYQEIEADLGKVVALRQDYLSSINTNL